MLNLGSTHMAGFMDACVQASEILIPFLDTLVAGNIRPDETKFITSPKGVYLYSYLQIWSTFLQIVIFIAWTVTQY